MDILSALRVLTTRQEAITITDPVEASIARAYEFSPPDGAGIENGHVWLNSWQLVRHESAQSNGREQTFTVLSQLLAEEGDLALAVEIATAFLNPYLNEIEGNQSLKDDAGVATVSQIKVVSSRGVIYTDIYGADARAGIEVVQEIEMRDTAAWAA